MLATTGKVADITLLSPTSDDSSAVASQPVYLNPVFTLSVKIYHPVNQPNPFNPTSKNKLTNLILFSVIFVNLRQTKIKFTLMTCLSVILDN